MTINDRELKALCIAIIEEAEAAAVTPGVVRQQLEVQHGVPCVVERLALPVVRQQLEVQHGRKYGHTEIFDLLHELEDEGKLVYHRGEYNEFAVPE